MPGEDCRMTELPVQIVSGPAGVITGFRELITCINAGMEPEMGPHNNVLVPNVTGNIPAVL